MMRKPPDGWSDTPLGGRRQTIERALTVCERTAFDGQGRRIDPTSVAIRVCTYSRHRADDGEREGEGGFCAVLHAVYYTIFDCLIWLRGGGFLPRFALPCLQLAVA